MLRREVVAKWGMRSVHEIGKRQNIELVSEVTARGAPSAANKLLKIVKTFFGWCVGRAILDMSPAKGLAAPARETALDRVLDDDELAHIVGAARQIDGPYVDIKLSEVSGWRLHDLRRTCVSGIQFASVTELLKGAVGSLSAYAEGTRS